MAKKQTPAWQLMGLEGPPPIVNGMHSYGTVWTPEDACGRLEANWDYVRWGIWSWHYWGKKIWANIKWIVRYEWLGQTPPVKKPRDATPVT